MRLQDMALAAAAGVAATKLMNPATTRMLELQTDEAKQEEKEASYGVAYNVAAKKTAGALGVDLSDDQAETAGTALHYGLGAAWAPMYIWLRRAHGHSPFGAAMATAMTMYTIVDEVANPLLGFTPPPKAYPLVTHLRGLAGHMVYGLALALLVEAGWWMLGQAKRRT